MTGMNNELIELNDTLLKKSGTLSVILANNIIDTLKDLSKDELKEALANIDSNMMLDRVFTSSFSRKELEICTAIKEIIDERQAKFTN